jgi:hypothetical protein
MSTGALTPILRIELRPLKVSYPFRILRENGSLPTINTTRAALSAIERELNAYRTYRSPVKIFYVLEVSSTKPTQFRVSVIRGGPDMPHDPAFIYIGVYATPELLTDALEPYLQMEEGST